MVRFAEVEAVLRERILNLRGEDAGREYECCGVQQKLPADTHHIGVDGEVVAEELKGVAVVRTDTSDRGGKVDDLADLVVGDELTQLPVVEEIEFP